MWLFNGLFAGEVGKTEPQLEPLWCAGLYVLLAFYAAFFSASDADVAAGQGRHG